MSAVRSLLFSTLYPSSVRPGHGIFVETRLRELLKSGEVECKVVSPVPWFFSGHERFGNYGLMARTPARELHNGIDVVHPRYLLAPKIGMNAAPFTMAMGAIAAVRNLIREGFDFDVIDAHYFYPDCVAAAFIARWLGKPLVITARGSDVNLIAQYPLPRRLMLGATRTAHACVTVSAALRSRLVEMGADPAKMVVLRNGVDLDRFRPVPPVQARSRLGLLDRPTLLSVGNLVTNKGHHLVIEALAKLPEFQLVIAGQGIERAALMELAHRTGVAERVIFSGQVAQTDLPTYYSAADMLILASEREGWPNVLLESMACGTPVVATNVGGVPEIIGPPHTGRVVAERSLEALVAGIADLWRSLPDRVQVSDYARAYSWDETTRGQLALFRAAVQPQQRRLALEEPIAYHPAGHDKQR
jgi:teichuronic acid biosynthesis glycosyltransferase TuaC